MEEFGREMYKLYKTFNAKAKQLTKERERAAGDNLGGGVKGHVEEPQQDEFAPVKISQSIQDQIKQFKVSWLVVAVGVAG